jgi:hypothetical protein
MRKRAKEDPVFGKTTLGIIGAAHVPLATRISQTEKFQKASPLERGKMATARRARMKRALDYIWNGPEE